MRVLAVAAILSFVAPASAQQAFEPTPLPPHCLNQPTDACPLLQFTRRVFAPALNGVTLAPAQGHGSLFLATTTDPRLPAFRLIWIEEQPMTPDRVAGEFVRGLPQPGQICGSDPARPTAIGRSYALRCAGGSTPAIRGFLHAVPGRERTTVFVMLAPLEHGPALLARAERMAEALAQAAAASQRPPATPQGPQAYVRPPNYDRLRADCADDADVARQIAGCEAVLANPEEQGNFAIAINNRGHARERSGDRTAALRDYERSAALDPAYGTAHVNRGRMLAALGRPDEAIAAFDRSIAIEDNGWARRERGRVHAARNDRARAQADFEAAVRMMPDDAEARAELDRIRTAQAAPVRPPAAGGARNPLEAAVLGTPARAAYVGEALLRAPLGPLPTGDALLAYTRDLLAPMLGAGATLTPFGDSGTAYQAQAPGMPQLTMRWYDGPSPEFARNAMEAFERDLNGGCVRLGPANTRLAQGTRVVIHNTVCPNVDPPYRLWWLEVSDNARSRSLLVATPSREGGTALTTGHVRMMRALAVDVPPAAATGPDLGALAEVFLADYILGGAMNAEQRRAITRPAANVARFENPPSAGDAGWRAEVEARSCTEMVWRDTAWTSRLPVDVDTYYDLPALARLTQRDGANIRLLAGSYGRRVDHRQNGPDNGTGPMQQQAGLLQAGTPEHGDAERLLRLVDRFCAAPGTPSRQAAAPAPASVEVRTTRGLMRDKPYSLSYPADLAETPGGDAEVTLADAAQTFEATLTIRSATPSLSAEFDARAFNGPDFIRIVGASVPGARLVGSGLMQLPAGPAHVVHFAAPASNGRPAYHYVDASLYEGGRHYRLFFSVTESTFQQRRDTIGFMLANVALSAAARQCCEAAVALPW